MTLSQESLVAKRTQVFDIPRITRFRYVEKPALSDHSLAGKSFDYLEFQTQDKVNAEVFGGNRIVQYQQSVAKTPNESVP